MRLYASTTSPYARKVRAVICEKQLAVEFVPVTPSDPRVAAPGRKDGARDEILRTSAERRFVVGRRRLHARRHRHGDGAGVRGPALSACVEVRFPRSRRVAQAGGDAALFHRHATTQVKTF